ncbi:hypothetical protein SAMN00808754_1465 [Thermanaeromonas toyohensis ToBE]|uniref:TrbC/VIRB2 family protein n=1 Tax=Thermanaeromonas toyohensis ToBE TaxID=698762 RepID=A0A1W1VSL2_9FIRM|nr:pilin [Thermanaeromonas toyohensis]SMB96362.1 hypothetical protein SAMN00808754_1465 [Thermanaeromonas toyohensis ToBE]
MKKCLDFLTRNAGKIAGAVSAAWLALGVKCQMALAAVKIWGFDDQSISADDSAKAIAGRLKDFADAIIGFVAVAAVLAMIAAGFVYITSGGSERRVETAKNIVLYSIVGIGLALFAKLIVNFAVYKLSPPATP